MRVRIKFFSALAPLAIYDIVFCSIADFFVMSSENLESVIDTIQTRSRFNRDVAALSS